MDVFVGGGLLIAAVLTIALGRRLLNRAGPQADAEAFGGAEFGAFIFTVFSTGAIVAFTNKVVTDPSVAGLSEIAFALAVAATVSVGLWSGLVRIAALPGATQHGSSDTPPPPLRGGRPSGTPAGKSSAGKVKKAA
ncbi:MAG TPA: hypothetical protein VLA52_03720 [Thermohalobaculum sp.]|nr:hypothetical protein [Thermohalobaculum sp.]